ncbi:MAG: site-specific integrase [Frankiaceae bacterium]|nr:site-specific integrase [Frankiaceae bacterium]MBV9871837.1 site-specific integrase [Frankiaceae bacterium]
MTTQRRQHGEGSLFYSEAAGRWIGFVDLGRDGAGKRRRAKVTGRTKAEARAKLSAALRKVEDGVPVGDQRTTVADLLESWLANPPAQAESGNTIAVYEWAINKHLIPALGHKRLRDLTPDDVESMLAAKAADGMAKASLARIRSVLVRALRQAERRGAIARNVAELVDTPAGSVRKSRSLTVEQAAALLEAAKGDRLEAAIVTGLMCGLRPGELLGLTWSCVDLEVGTLTVRRALLRHGSDLVLGDVKTSTSRRTLRMPSPVVDALRALKRDQASERLAAAAWSDQDLVFSTGVGTPVDPANLRRTFSRLTTKANLGHWHPHELRHSAASILSAAGVRIEEIADLLGHESIRVTSQVYRHLLTPEIVAAVEPMEAAFGGTAS